MRLRVRACVASFLFRPYPHESSLRSGADDRGLPAATGDGSGEEVLFVAAGVVYSSIEAALVAGLAPTILADSTVFHFDGRCVTKSLASHVADI